MSNRTIHSIRFLPTGMDENDLNTHHFNIYVIYVKNDEYTISEAFAPHSGDFYDFEKNEWAYSRSAPNTVSLEEACSIAEKEVNLRRINGKTWAEWENERASKETL